MSAQIPPYGATLVHCACGCPRTFIQHSGRKFHRACSQRIQRERMRDYQRRKAAIGRELWTGGW